jgi:hypothetical protein
MTGELTVRAKRSGEWQHPLAELTLKYFAAIAVDRKPEEPLFLDYRKRPWKLTSAGEADRLTWWYAKHVGDYLKLPGKLGTVYRLKDYVISKMRRAGIDNATIAAFTGHLTLSQLDTYHKTGEDLKRAALKTVLPQLLPQATPRTAVSKKHLRHPKVAQVEFT